MWSVNAVSRENLKQKIHKKFVNFKRLCFVWLFFTSISRENRKYIIANFFHSKRWRLANAANAFITNVGTIEDSGCGATFSQVFHVLPVTLWSLINYNSLDPFWKTVECQFACILKPALALALVYIVIRLVRRKLMSKKWKARFSSLECVDVIIEKYLVDPVKTGRWRMFRV